jgi:tRNA(fMet)-specific endonuclease VapC
VLDTDVLTLWLRGQETIGARVAATPPQQLSVTIITMEEVLGGWYTQIRQARDDQQLARAYQALHEAIEFSWSIRILPFDLPEIRRYRQLRTQHRRIGTNDLRIAAIVLEQQAILVTRNTSDFADISGLQLDNWALANAQG